MDTNSFRRVAFGKRQTAMLKLLEINIPFHIRQADIQPHIAITEKTGAVIGIHQIKIFACIGIMAQIHGQPIGPIDESLKFSQSQFGDHMLGMSEICAVRRRIETDDAIE